MIINAHIILSKIVIAYCNINNNDLSKTQKDLLIIA